MNTAVGIMQTEQIGRIKKSFVGKSYSITAGDEFKITVGKSSLVMNADGSIIITGSSIITQAEKENKVIGKDVLINPPGGGASTSSQAEGSGSGASLDASKLSGVVGGGFGGGLTGQPAQLGADGLPILGSDSDEYESNIAVDNYDKDGNYLGSHDLEDNPSGLMAEYAKSSEELGRIIRVYGENSVVGKQAMAELERRKETKVYTDVEKQLKSNRRQNASARAAEARNSAAKNNASRGRTTQNNSIQNNSAQNNPTQRPLDITQGQPPSLYDDIGYENPMAKVRDGWKGEAVDGIKKSTGALVGAGSEISPIFQTGSNIYKDVASGEYREAANKGVGAVGNKVKETAIESAKDYGASKSKVLDRANDIYGDYNKAQDMQSQAEEAAEWKRNQNE